MRIANYEITATIAEGAQAAVYRAHHRRNPGVPLILKVLKTVSISEHRQAQFKQKIEELKVLTDPQLVVPLSFGVEEGTCFLTHRDVPGMPLDQVVDKPLGDLDAFLSLACKIAQALEKVHEAGVIHGGIKPHNILVDQEKETVYLIDFIGAVDVRNVSLFINDGYFIRHTLAYTAPEQTGRINHRVDFTSDLYSLGIIFYELLTGQLPFTAADPLELIHLHLAEEARPISSLNPRLPKVLCSIVAKLMSKQPERRYQSCAGLLADLQRCRESYRRHGEISDFPLERSNSANKFNFISKMVGRDEEKHLVLAKYQTVVHGGFQFLLLSGAPGIGKTRLIQELQGPLVKNRGYYTSGKFDLYQRNIPYSALIQALRKLVRTFLTESDRRIEQWATKILTAVGDNGQVLIEVIPELELLIGPQPQISPLPPMESVNRFNAVFNRFLSSLSSRETPLILFVDDLQWCDAASFELLNNILANYADYPYLFLLGAYRNNEVDSSHPMVKLIKTAKEHNWPLTELQLQPLNSRHSHEMVSYILDYPLNQTRTLSKFISALSEGNPLFVSESLSYLYNENLLYLAKDGEWQWDLNRIRQAPMPKDIVALFAAKVQKLPSKLRSLLEFCACMGNTFSAAEIAAIQGISLQEACITIKPAIRQGLLVENNTQLQFIHDRVQEAVLASIPGRRRQRIHRRIAEHLFSALPQGADLEKCPNLFTIVSHYNLAGVKSLDPQRAYFLSDLNYHAGNKAYNSLAIAAANDYYRQSLKLLPKSCWQDQYRRTYRIYQRAAKTELMCGNYSQSERLLAQLLKNAKTDLDRVECLAEQTTSLSSIGNFKKAIETANEGLAFFGKAIPMDAQQAEQKRKEILAEIEVLDADLHDTILSMPFTSERRSKIELAFYSELIPDLYMSGMVPQLYLAAAQSTQHCLAGGMDESVIYAFTIMALMLSEDGLFQQSFAYEDLARDLSAKYPNTFGATRGMNGIVWCNMHSRSHPREIVEYCLKAIQCGKNCGDLYNAGLSYGPLMWNLQVQGADLARIEEYAQECLDFSRRYNLMFSQRLAEAMLAGWIKPMQKNYVLAPMQCQLEQWMQDNHIASVGSYYVLMGIVHYYLGDYRGAEKYLGKVPNYISGLTDNVLKRQWHVFLILNQLKLTEAGKSREAVLAEIQPSLEKVERWAELGPLLKPYLALIYAELTRVTGNIKRARNMYLDAIQVADQQGYTLLQGYINECLGEMLLDSGQGIGTVYLKEAQRLYLQCRAERKELNLLEKYPFLYHEGHALIAATAPPSPWGQLPDLSPEYLMKFALAISSEIQQEALLKKIMNVVIESSGAQQGCLLIAEGNTIYIRAHSEVHDKESVATVKQALEEAETICRAIVRYVYRTGEKVLLANASQEGAFKDNPEVQELGLRSVLCLPIVKQGRTIGIVYLENRLADGVFTMAKTRVTELLISQAAISLDNARLVEKMQQVQEELRRAKESLEQRVQERTAELAAANYLLAEDIARRQQAEALALAERQRFNDIVELLPCYLILIKPDYYVSFANRVFRETFGDPTGKRCYHHLFGLDGPCENCRAIEALETNAPVEWEWQGPNQRNYIVFDFPFTDSDGSSLILEIGIDITERKKAEEEIQVLNRELEERVSKRTAQLAASEADLRKALHEKEALLKEVHHRVKNNLQIVYSMLNLQLPYIQDELAVKTFKESQDRIYSMALIHEKLYESESLAKVHMGEYLHSLLDNLLKSYGADKNIQLQLEVEEVDLDIDTVVPCALIINELVSNVLKHAFPVPGDDNLIFVQFRRKGRNKLILAVGDNGVGLPQDFRIEESQTLGLRLVRILAKQLRGSIEVAPRGPTIFTIKFEKKR